MCVWSITVYHLFTSRLAFKQDIAQGRDFQLRWSSPCPLQAACLITGTSVSSKWEINPKYSTYLKWSHWMVAGRSVLSGWVELSFHSKLQLPAFGELLRESGGKERLSNHPLNCIYWCLKLLWASHPPFWSHLLLDLQDAQPSHQLRVGLVGAAVQSTRGLGLSSQHRDGLLPTDCSAACKTWSPPLLALLLSHLLSCQDFVTHACFGRHSPNCH